MRSISISVDALDTAEAYPLIMDKLADFSFAHNSFALLFTEQEFDNEELLQKLRSAFPFMTIIGCTAIAQFSNSGYTKTGITLLVATADDCFFSAAACENMHENGEEKLKDLYAEALQGLGGRPPEAAFYFSIINQGTSEQKKFNLLDSLLGSKPVIGGIASDFFAYDELRVFCNEKEYKKGIVIMLVAGNFKPIMKVGNVAKGRIAKHRITEAEGTVIKSIDNILVKDFLTQNGINYETSAALSFTPLSIELPEEKNTGFTLCRPLLEVDEKTGYGICFAEVPNGAAMSFQMLQAADIAETSKQTMQELVDAVEKAQASGTGEKYETILCVSCIERHLVMGINPDKEFDLASEIFSSAFQFAAFYSFGEFLPTAVADGKARNHLHNHSIALCAF